MLPTASTTPLLPLSTPENRGRRLFSPAPILKEKNGENFVLKLRSRSGQSVLPLDAREFEMKHQKVRAGTCACCR